LNAEPVPTKVSSIVQSFCYLIPELTKLFMNFFWNMKKAITRGMLMMKVAAQTLAHCMTASLDLAKECQTDCQGTVLGGIGHNQGQRKLFQW
jgi:hypothetical protein